VAGIAGTLGVTLDELAVVASTPPIGNHRLVDLLVGAGMDRRDALVKALDPGS
jgi:hypothetical protein